MTDKIYCLDSDTRNYSLFIQDYDFNKEESIMGVAMKSRWLPLHVTSFIKLELNRSDKGKKNYQFDISGSLGPFFIFSELALDKLGDVFKPRGQILPVITESKKKKFFGYYPTNPLSGCFDKEKSVYRVAERGLIIEKPVLIAENITDEYLFSIEEDISRVFVTDKFKERVEEAGLLGFDFSVEIPLT